MKKPPKEPAPVGRPDGYKPEFAAQAEKLCNLGATDEDLSDFFGVSSRTIYRWAAKFPKFCQSLKEGKDAADERVVRSLYHKAVGYTYDSEKIFQVNGEALRVPVKEHVPPDTTAAIFWLKNRRRAEWRDRHEHEHGKPGEFADIDNSRSLEEAIAERLGVARSGNKETGTASREGSVRGVTH